MFPGRYERRRTGRYERCCRPVASAPGRQDRPTTPGSGPRSGLRGAALVVGLLGVMWAAMLLVGVAGWAQQPGSQSAATAFSDSTSELARDNLDRVAASTAQIMAVLDVNAGLRVELKRWIAKDAADHGQIVEDSDLEDAAIDTRLAHDAKFRAAATRLLQGYGYLVANTNPNSEVGRERNALVQARIRRLLGPGPAENITAPCVAAGCRNSGSGAQGDSQSQAAASRGGMARDLGQFPIGRDSLNFDVLNPDLINPDSVNPEFLNPGALDPGSLNPGSLNPGSLNPDAADPGMGSPGPGNGGDWNRGTNDDARTLRTSANPGEGNPRASLLSAGMGDSAGFGMWTVTADSQSAVVDGSRLSRESASPQSSPLSRDPQAQAGLMARAWTGSAEAKAGSFEAEVAAEMGPPGKPMHRSPYADIPSVYDMYVQATAPAPGPVRRFGEDVFRNFRNAPPAAAGAIPIDFPASADYVVGPGDGLTINLWGGVSQRLSRTVDREGRVSLPEVGPVLVNGQSLGAVQQVVQRLLRTQFHDVSADVSLSRLRTVRVYVVGEIVRPGAYDVSSLSTPLNALLAAGGPTPEGSLRAVKHYRGGVLVQRVDLYDLLLRGVRSDAKRRQGFASEKIALHYTGIDTGFFHPDDSVVREPLVLFVVRLTEKKGCEYLIRAMAEIQLVEPDVDLVLIGDGPLRPSLERMAQTRLRKFQFLGAQPPEIVRKWMNRARVFSVPSVRAVSGDGEGFGMVFAEAQAMKLPVASFDSGGIPEAVAHGETGLLASERDCRALAQNILLLLQNDALWQRMSVAGHLRVRSLFNLRTQTPLLESLYHRVLGWPPLFAETLPENLPRSSAVQAS